MNLQFFVKLFDYINYMYVRKVRICSFSLKIQSMNSSILYIGLIVKSLVEEPILCIL